MQCKVLVNVNEFLVMKWPKQTPSIEFFVWKINSGDH